jgi:hypothetical protein
MAVLGLQDMFIDTQAQCGAENAVQNALLGTVARFVHARAMSIGQVQQPVSAPERRRRLPEARKQPQAPA